MIESNERGFTINKTLSWAMVVTIAGAVYWFGSEMTATRQGVEGLETRQGEDRRDIRANADSIRELQRSNARIDERLLNIEQSATRTEESVAEILRYLRASGATP